MGFDSKAFTHEQWERRTMDFPVPQLKQWFGKSDKPIWKIQSLSGTEIGLAEQAVSNYGLTGKIFDALLSANSKEVADHVRELVGRSQEKPAMMAKRIHHLVYGSVDPKCDMELAVKFCDQFPVLFIEITNAIYALSGQGSTPGKQKPSGGTKK